MLVRGGTPLPKVWTCEKWEEQPPANYRNSLNVTWTLDTEWMSVDAEQVLVDAVAKEMKETIDRLVIEQATTKDIGKNNENCERTED